MVLQFLPPDVTKKWHDNLLKMRLNFLWCSSVLSRERTFLEFISKGICISFPPLELLRRKYPQPQDGYW